MESFEPNTPHPADIARRVAVFPAVKKRRQAATNIWFFDSPKNGKRHIISGDLSFMHFVLLEGTQTVQGYEPNPLPVSILHHENLVDVRADAYVHFVDGHREWWNFIYKQRRNPVNNENDELQILAAKNQGMLYQIRTQHDLKQKTVFFDNWLNLCAGISRCRSMLLHRELDFIREATSRAPTKVAQLFDTEIDPACMFAAIGLSLQRGIVSTDLERKLFGYDSILTKGML